MRTFPDNEVDEMSTVNPDFLLVFYALVNSAVGEASNHSDFHESALDVHLAYLPTEKLQKLVSNICYVITPSPKCIVLCRCESK